MKLGSSRKDVKDEKNRLIFWSRFTERLKLTEFERRVKYSKN